MSDVFGYTEGERTVLDSFLQSPAQIHKLLNLITGGTVEWVLADRQQVVYISAGGPKILDLAVGTPVANHDVLSEVLQKGVRLVKRYVVQRDEVNFEGILVAIPLQEQGQPVTGALLYISPDTEGFNPAGILDLLQEMNRENDMEAALNVLTTRSLKMFDSEMAGIWLLKDNCFQSLAVSAQSEAAREFLVGTSFPADRKIVHEGNPEMAVCSHEQMILADLDRNGGEDTPFAGWAEGLHRLGIKRLLCVPLLHFGQMLGVFALFSQDPVAFNGISIHWLNRLAPLISSFVHEQQLWVAAWEKEQALTLLLRGTEILVQADSEEQLLTEAGEMAMEILYLEAGFFLLQEGESWQVRAPFGRLKHSETVWQEAIFQLVNSKALPGYVPHRNTTVKSLAAVSQGLSLPFQWQKILIQPLQTHSGVVGELWLMDSRSNALEQRQEILAAFVRGLGVALETIRQRRELERTATTDRLTGILNRQGFEQRIHEEMAGTIRRGSGFLLLILDLDGFKNLNDTQGHPAGDAALRHLAQNLRSSTREQDIVARTGGDEFSVVLTDLRRGPEAVRIIQRLRRNMELGKFSLGVSIGVAEFPEEAGDYEGLYRLADQRLYVGKFQGKGKIVTGDGFGDDSGVDGSRSAMDKNIDNKGSN